LAIAWNVSFSRERSVAERGDPQGIDHGNCRLDRSLRAQ